jgi:hypothetical protein
VWLCVFFFVFVFVFVFSSALCSGHDAIVLSAWGCGAYGCPPEHV